jgi:multicomponent Na+:H+ antiporter subunit A
MGFLAKELLYAAAMSAPFLKGGFVIAIFVTGLISTYLAILLGWKVFFSKVDQIPEGSHEVKAGMFLGPLLLGVTGLFTGILPEISIQGLLSQTASAVSTYSIDMKLHLWHGFNAVLGLSALTLLAGYGLYRYSRIFGNSEQRIQKLEPYGPENLYDKSWEWLLKFAELITRFFQSGYLRYYVTTIIITLVILAISPIFYYRLFNFNFSLGGVEVYEVILVVLVIASVIFTVLATSRLAAIAILGVAGYGVAIIFAIYGAVDLAMTQFLIETLTVVVFVLVLYKLPGYIKLSPGLHRQRDVLVAIAGGATMTMVILLVTNYPMISELKLFFVENSYILAKGRNVVNVILVDFRGLDTMGEITVLAIAALGVFAMMKLRLKIKNPKSKS